MASSFFVFIACKFPKNGIRVIQNHATWQKHLQDQYKNTIYSANSLPWETMKVFVNKLI